MQRVLRGVKGAIVPGACHALLLGSQGGILQQGLLVRVIDPGVDDVAVIEFGDGVADIAAVPLA